ncbi:MAG TPA: hypothetical protein VL418_10600 [Devosiaceae bacterium]|nr:hypothetical protein [Devosiaceae bacterium]
MRQGGCRPSGFDYMRPLFAIGIVASVDISYGPVAATKFWDSPFVGIMIPGPSQPRRHPGFRRNDPMEGAT